MAVLDLGARKATEVDSRNIVETMSPDGEWWSQAGSNR